MLKRHRHSITSLIGAALIAALVVVRFSSLQPIDEPSLRALVKSGLQQELAELALHHGNALLQAEDGERLRDLEASVVEIYAMKASRPALAFGTDGKVVVRVDYAIRDGDGHRKQQQRYLEAHRKSADEWWLTANESSAVSYYFNLF